MFARKSNLSIMQKSIAVVAGLVVLASEPSVATSAASNNSETNLTCKVSSQGTLSTGSESTDFGLAEIKITESETGYIGIEIKSSVDGISPLLVMGNASGRNMKALNLTTKSSWHLVTVFNNQGGELRNELKLNRTSGELEIKTKAITREGWVSSEIEGTCRAHSTR
jgi:hypothetical protein